jgi:nitroimidazol reductase NimA-like FMN-containing flavoprotein (pyridoxamine 5'-phosphate oxidase superfamily)
LALHDGPSCGGARSISSSAVNRLAYGVIVSERYEELPDTPGFAADRARAQEALQTRAMWWEYATVPAAEWRHKSGPFAPIFYRIHIEKITGHRATPSAPS